MTAALRVARRVLVEISGGAPLAMLKVYARLEWWHARAGHDGPAMECTPCHLRLVLR